MDPIFEEMARARDVQPRALRRWVDYLRDVVQPQLDELAAIKAAGADAFADGEARDVAPPKRGPGRPRKDAVWPPVEVS